MILNTMKQDVKQKWIAALRSGEYQQGILALRKEQDKGVQYCCLGVLCDLYLKEAAGPNAGWKRPEGSTVYELVDPDTNTKEGGLLPNIVQEWSGLLRTAIVLKGSKSPSCFTYLNDSKKMTFSQIADLIEEYL